jgi:uncharacterized membrane protein YeaQ/YmgE (transglycosylase-associated protein family)
MVMKILIRKYLLTIIFAAVGAVAGFVYWKFVGCASGTCVIKSVWYLSTLYGLVFGGLIGNLAEDLVKKFKKEKKI